jgi:hypothetical protein
MDQDCENIGKLMQRATGKVVSGNEQRAKGKLKNIELST